MRTDNKTWLYRQVAWCVLLLGLLVTVLVGLETRRDVEDAAVSRFAYASDQITAKVRERLVAQEMLLRGGAAFLSTADDVSRADWRRFWDELQIQQLLPGLQGFGFAQQIAPEQLEAHVQRVRREGFPDYTVRPAGPREVYTSIVYLEPFIGRNLRAFGYDMFSDPVRRQAMEQARDTGQAALTGRVTLVQEDDHAPQAGVLMYVPVYRKGLPLQTQAQSQAALLGWSYSPYRMDDLMAGMLRDWQGQLGTQILLSVYDGPQASAQTLLYSNRSDAARPRDALFAQERSIAFHGRTWLLTFDLGTGPDRLDYTPLWRSLLSGAALSSLLFLLVRNLQSRSLQASRIADQLTADIRRQEQRLRESEFRWNFALDGSGLGVWDWNIATHEAFYSPRWKQLLGFSDEEIGNSYQEWEQRIHPEDKPQMISDLQAYLAGKTPDFDVTHRLLAKDGRPVWVRVRGAVVERSQAGQPLRMIGTTSDVTEQTRNTLRVQQLARLNAAMSECNAAIIHCATQDQLFDRITRVVVESGGMAMCWIGLTDAPAGMVRPVHAFGRGTDYLQGIEISVLTDDPRGNGATGTAVRENRSVWIEDFQTDPRTVPWRDRAAQFGWRSSAALPIARAGEPIGALTFYDEQVGWYDGEVRALLESFAGQISFALDKFDAQAQVQEQQQRVLQASAHLQQVFEATPVPMQIYAVAQQRLRFINRAHRQWLGYELQEIATMAQWHVAMGYPPQVRAEHQQRCEATMVQLQDGQATVVQLAEFSLRTKDGSLRVAQPVATRVGDDIVMVWADLTDIRHQESELRESEKRFRSMVEHSVSSMYVRRDNQLIYVNDSFCRMLGRSADELLGHDVAEFMATSPQEWQQVLQARAQAQAGGHHVPAEATVRHKDGSLIEVGFSISPIEWEDGQPAVIGLAEDITARKRAAEQIASYVRRLEESLQATLQVVSTMVEMRDPYTAGHERRVGLVAAAIAQELGWSAERCKTMEMVGLVHDIGKIAVPSEILTKPTRLSPIEMRLVQEHAQAGYDILKGVPFDAPVAEIIRQHHERMDGSGYPRALKGDDILPEARVLAVADVLESMAAHRPYRPALGLDVALQELLQNQGRLYDPAVVEATARLIRDKGYVLPQ